MSLVAAFLLGAGSALAVTLDPGPVSRPAAIIVKSVTVPSLVLTAPQLAARPMRQTASEHRTGPHAPFAVGLRIVRFVDRNRSRTLVTYVRYPARGGSSGSDLAGAPAASTGGPYPLIVFAHGFDVMPDTYQQLMRAWTRAGYVVAAPVLPFSNAAAPGGATRSDIPNQPQDLRFVASRLAAASAARGDPFSGLIDPRRIGVSGQSDGGDTALAVAYGQRNREPGVRAVVVLSGAELQGLDTLTFTPDTPPLLAVQGTADSVNPPAATTEYFDAVRRPKYLLSLLGAEHLAPFSYEQPHLRIVERVTLAFFDAKLKGERSASARLLAAGHVPNRATLLAQP